MYYENTSIFVYMEYFVRILTIGLTEGGRGAAGGGMRSAPSIVRDEPGSCGGEPPQLDKKIQLISWLQTLQEQSNPAEGL